MHLQPNHQFHPLYREIERIAALHSIFLRTGCFCNPGACASHLGLTAEQLRQNFEAGHVCWDDNDVIDGRWVLNLQPPPAGHPDWVG